jgi:hypothetical protein
MPPRTFFVAISVLVLSALPAMSKGGGGAKDDPWNPDHILMLPAEIRHYIATICKGPASARHDFATYSPLERRWRINIEYLRCEGLGEFRRGHQCVDVDFVQVGAHFRLSNKQYRECGF